MPDTTRFENTCQLRIIRCMEQRLNNIVKQLTRRMGTQLEALYVYGSYTQHHYLAGESDINLLAVVNDGASIHALRDTFLPIWEEHRAFLRHAPLIVRQSEFSRHMQLNPMLAYHLANNGRLLMGLPDLLLDLPPINQDHAFARLAFEAMQASAALTPELLPSDVAETRLLQLRRLARRIKGDMLTADESPAQMLARIHHFLTPQITKLPTTQKLGNTQMLATNAPLLPGLQAIYKETDNMVFVFGNLPPQQIMKTNWAILVDRLKDQCSGLTITTTAQLSLVVLYETPLALLFKRHQHQWGLQPLANLTASKQHLLRHAARTPSDIQIDFLPNDYLTHDSEQAHRIIHDFQNKLLNVQLEHELLCRMKVTERFTPPSPLPPRTAPHPVRIDAIFNHLGWWADFYANEMDDDWA